MSFRKLAAVLLAGGLALAACGQQSSLGSSGASAPPVATAANFPQGSTMATLAQAGTIRVGTKFDQPLFGLKGLDGKPEGFDRSGHSLQNSCRAQSSRQQATPPSRAMRMRDK